MKAVANAEGRIHVLDDTGTPVTIDQADLPAALDAGFQLETAESVSARHVERERSTLGQKALTAGEAALSEATIGLSDAALVAGLGDEYRQAAFERRQVNPNTALAGKVVGAIAPMLASGGSSAAARGIATVGAPSRLVAGAAGLVDNAAMGTLRALGYTGASALSRAAARGTALAVAGAADGALMGLGQSISDAALGGTEWTAEKALATAKTNALYGLAAGGVVGAGSELGKAAAQSIVQRMTGGQTLREALVDFGEKRAFKSVSGNYKKWYDRATNFGRSPDRINRIGSKLIDAEIPLDKLDDAARALTGKVDDAGSRMQAIAKQLDDAGVRVDGRAVLSKVDEQIAKLRSVELEDFQAVARKVEKQVAPFRRVVEGSGDLGVYRVRQNVGVRQGVLQKTRELTPVGGRDYTFSDFWKLRQNLDKTINWASRAQNPAVDALKDLRSTFDDALTAVVEHGDDEAAGALKAAWKAAKEDYSDFRLAKDAAEDQLLQREKNRFISASDYGVGATTSNVLGLLAGIATGSVGVGALTGVATGAAASVAHKYIRERGSGAIANLATGMVRYDRQMRQTAEALAGVAGRRRPGLAAITADEVTRTTVEEGAKALDASPLERIIRPQHAASRGVRTLLTGFDGVQAAVTEHQRNPDATVGELARVLEPFAHGNPEVATQMGVTVVRDMQYLAAETPRAVSRAGSSLTPGAEEMLVPRVAKPSLVRKAEALADPESVLRDLERGKLNLDGIRALKDRRPELYEELRMEVMQMAATAPRPLPYHRRVMLSMAFGFVGDMSMRPGQLAAIQASGAPPAEAEGGAPAQAGKGADESADEMMTPSQEAIGL